MDLFIALAVCFGIFAIGDILGVATKAKVSSVFVALLVFLVGFMSGIIPKDIIDTSTLSVIASWASGYVVFHMGTMINLRQLANEWRTVVLTLLSMVVVGLGMLVLIPVIGNNMAITAIPVMNGGIIATQIMSEAAMNAGAPLVAAFAAILYALNKFVGTPIASFVGLREAREILRKYRDDKNSVAVDSVKEAAPAIADKPQQFYEKYNKYFTDFVCIGTTALLVLLCFAGAQLLNSGIQALGVQNFSIHYTIICLITGATIGYFGLVPPKILEKGKASGLLTVAIFGSLIPSLATIKFEDFSTLGFNLILTFAVALIVIFVVFYLLPVGKFVRSKNIAIGIAMGQFLGFPATYLISQEIAKAVSDDPEEQEVVMSVISPSYVVAGFASVTTFSIIVAGLMTNFIQ